MRYILAVIIFGNTLFANLAFLGLIDSRWQIVVLDDNGSIETISTQLEPHSFDYNSLSNRVVYMASDESLRLIENKKERVILKRDKDSYIQPKFSKNGEKVYMVKLFDGTSKNSDIIEIDIKSKKSKIVVNQRSTQLEPFISDSKNIYYTNVICTIGCRDIISEIWHKNIISGEAKQLTLTNLTTQQPSVDSESKNLYFSSNSDEFFHIYRYNFEKKEYQQMTKAEASDGFPIKIKDTLYFVRQMGTKSKLMAIDNGGNVKEIPLPQNVEKIRYLRSI